MRILLLALALTFNSLGAVVVEKIAAKVGREVILESEVAEQMQQLKAAGVNEDDITRDNVINQMVESRLIVQKAKDLSLTVDDLKIRDMAEEQYQKVAARFGSPEQFDVELKKAGLTSWGLKDYYVKMLTEQKLKDQIISQEIRSKVRVTSGEVEDYYQEHKAEFPDRPPMDELAVIKRTVKAGDTSRDKALKTINNIIDRLNKGEDFAALAKEASQDATAQSGGDLGWISRGTVIKSLEDAAWALKPGEISPVVETPLGFHVIKLEEQRDTELHIRHILIKTDPVAAEKDKERRQMNDILARLDRGDLFSDLAEQFSEDPSKDNMGIIGEFTSETYPADFATQIKALDYGKYTGVLEKGDTFFIYKKVRQVPGRPYNFEEIQDNLRSMVQREKEKEVYDKWMADLKATSFVYIVPEN